MKCIYCGSFDSKVVDSRLSEDGSSIRRRRECTGCGKRFTTYETVEYTPVMVIKKNGVRQPFDVKKIKSGLIKACEKRPVSMYEIEKFADDIQKRVMNSLEQEISSKEIGEMIMDGLKKIDEVAYVRFASVYRQFKDVNTFITEIEQLMTKDTKKADKRDLKTNTPDDDD
ncbi:MAG: transcriptional regulator NrdR [Clostridiaceae bacterium]|jgi:transcriptional repressor NrdR|nr:transcriptional regulator NrdR [Clostridiaceae bacterium]